MKKTKLPLLILPLSLFTLVGCNKAKYNIGICQLIKHEALDAATKGFMDAVKEGRARCVEGRALEYETA